MNATRFPSIFIRFRNLASAQRKLCPSRGLPNPKMRTWPGIFGLVAFVSFVLITLVQTLPAQEVFTFASSDSFSFPDSGNASPYPSTVVVSGVSGTVISVNLGLNDLSHTWPDDLDIFLVAPSGLAIRVMSDAGGGSDLIARDLVFSDGAQLVLPDDAAITQTQYRAANYEGAEPLPPGAVTDVDTFLATAAGGVNGTWSLFVSDDAAGDIGSLNGWDIEFTTADREFVNTGAMTTPRSGHTATPLCDGTVLVVGGNVSGSVVATCEIYDSASGQWSPAGALVTARENHTASVLPNGQVLVAGGTNSGGATNTCELYDPITGVWSLAAGMNNARSQHTATLDSNGRVIVAGGFDPQSGVMTPTCERFDSATNSWTPLASLASARFDHTATWTEDGIIVVAGGFSTVSGFLGSIEYYDSSSASGSWITANASLATPRDRHTATRLRDGTVLIVGGRNLGGELAGVESLDPGSDTVVATASLTYARADHSASFLPHGELLIAGGNPTGQVAIAERYNPDTETWTPTGALTDGGLIAARSRHTATLLPGGAVLMVGGGLSPLAEIYPAQEGQWTSQTSLLVRRESHTATLLSDGKVLVVGGGGFSSTVTASAEIFDPFTNTTTATGSLAAPRVVATATALPDGTVLVVGGIVANSPSATVERFDPATGTWSSETPTSIPHNRHTAHLLPDGRVLVVGSSLGPTAEIFDPVSRTWTATNPMTIPRYAHQSAMLKDGRLLVAGGVRQGGGSFEPIAGAEIYDPTTDQWLPTGDMITNRYFFAMNTLADGRVLVSGGENFSQPDALVACEIFDPATGTWSPAASLNGLRRFHSSVLLGDGRVLVMGGDLNGNSNNSIASVEIYDPALDIWTFAPPLAEARSDFPAVILTDGSVLVTGGFTFAGIQGVERYDPAPGTDPANRTSITLFQISSQGRYRLAVANAREISDGSSGNSRDSGSASLLIQYRHLDSGCLYYLKPDPSEFLPPLWPEGYITAGAVELPLGYGLVTPIENGVPGTSRLWSPPGVTVEQIGGGPLVAGQLLVAGADLDQATTLAFRLVNRGGFATGISAGFSGPDAADFEVFAAPRGFLETYGNEIFVVGFDPSTDGDKSANLNITPAIPGDPLLNFAIRGEVLYTGDQLQALNIGSELIRRNPNGDFTIVIGVERSLDLNPNTFLPFPMSEPTTSIIDGKLEFTFPSTEDAAFFLLRAE